MFTTPRPRGPGRQLSPDQGAKLVMLAPILLNRLLMLLPSNVAPPAIASAMKMISIALFGRGRAAIVTAKAFEQSEHVHTPEIEPVTDPFAPRWNRRGRPAPAKAAYFCGPVRFGATYGHVCIKFCLVCNGKLALTNKKHGKKMINVFVPTGVYGKAKICAPHAPHY